MVEKTLSAICKILEIDDLSEAEATALYERVKEHISVVDYEQLAKEIIASEEHEINPPFCPRMQIELEVPCSIKNCRHYNIKKFYNCYQGSIDEPSWEFVSSSMNLPVSEVKAIYSSAIKKVRQQSHLIDSELDFTEYKPVYTYLNLTDRCMVCGQKPLSGPQNVMTQLVPLKHGQACRSCVSKKSRIVIDLEVRYRTDFKDLLLKTAKPYASLEAQSLALGVCIVTLVKLYNRCGLDRRKVFKNSLRTVRNVLANRPGKRTLANVNSLYRFFLIENINKPVTPLGRNLSTNLNELTQEIVDLSVKLEDDNSCSSNPSIQ